MAKTELFALTALFDSPNEIMKVVAAAKNKGFVDFDSHTPYPIHGLDHAQGLKPSTIGYVALGCGIFGLVWGLTLIYLTGVYDYPLVYAGKPYFSLPAFIPVLFETTVLTTAHLTVFALFIFYCKFPALRNPLQDSLYMANASCNKFGICIKAADKLFDFEKVRAFLQDSGGKQISEIFYDHEEESVLRLPYFGMIINKGHIIAGAVLLAVLVSVSTWWINGRLVNMVPFSWMDFQSKGKVQAAHSVFKDGNAMQMPPKGAIARGYLPLPTQGQNNPESVFLLNPHLPTSQILSQGRASYNIYCSVCHGDLGKGEGRLRGKFPTPPSLHSKKITNWNDGRIYHVISEGQNIMRGYAAQIPRDDRWAIVSYIRALQRSQHAKETD